MTRIPVSGRAAPVALGLAAAVVAVVAALTVSNAYVLAGLPDPGWVVDAGLPAARVVAIGSAALVVAHLLVAVAVPTHPRGSVSAAGFAAAQAARRWAWLLVAGAATATVLSVAENTGRTPGELLSRPGELLSSTLAADPPAGWLAVLVGALVLAVGTGAALTWRSAVGLLALAVVVLVPVPLTAALGVTRSSDVAMGASVLHTVAAVVWVGSTVAVLRQRSGPVAGAVRAVHRRLAAGCFVVVALSGLVVAVISVPAGALLRTAYGIEVVLSTVALLAVAAAGAWVRRRVTTRGDRVGRLGAAGLELTLLAVAAGAGTVLARQVPPVESTYRSTTSQDLIGYDLPAHLTALDLLTRWRADVLLGTLAVVLAAAYLLGVRRVHRAGRSHPPVRTAAWLAGCLVLLVGSCSGVSTYGRAVLSLHLVDMVLLGALAPVLLVLGHGASLALDASSPAGRERLGSLLTSPVVRGLRHPLVAWGSGAVLLLVLYPTGLFDSLVQDHWAHPLLAGVHLVTGLLLFWSLLGRSPGSDLPPLGRVVVVFAAMATHAAFYAWLLSRSASLAPGWFGSFDLPYARDLVADQRLGAVLAWALGEVPVVVAVGALVAGWVREEDAPAPPLVRSPDGEVPAPSRATGPAGLVEDRAAAGTVAR